MATTATLADIEKSYDEAIKKAAGSPEAVADLKNERAAAVADFRLRAVAEREMALWKREALAAYPFAKEFADQVVGDTEEAIAESAKALHERIAAMFETHARELEEKRLVEEYRNNQNKPPEEAQNDAGSA